MKAFPRWKSVGITMMLVKIRELAAGSRLWAKKANKDEDTDKNEEA